MRIPNAVLTLAVALTLSASARSADAEAITRKVEKAGGTVVRSPILKLGRPILAVTYRGKKADELLPVLAACESLNLNLQYSDVTDAGLTALRHSSVQALSLVDTAITDDAFATVAALRSLRELSAGQLLPFIDFTPGSKKTGGHAYDPLTDAALKRLASHPKLESLELYSVDITDDGLRHLVGLPKLKRIHLNSNEPITDAGLKTLGGIRTLEEIEIYAAKFTDTGLKHLDGLPRLRGLDLGDNPRLTDAGLKHLARHTGLRLLRLTNNAWVNDDSLTTLAPFTELESLNLANTLVSDAGLPTIAKLRHLASLDLHGTSVTDAGIAELSKLDKLRKLTLSITAVTPAGRAALRKALPKCVVLPADEPKR